MQSTELHIYTDFLRIVLEIINAILTYALPRNPEVCICLQFSLLDRTSTASNIFLQVVYAVLHRQEVFEPRFNELLQRVDWMTRPYLILCSIHTTLQEVQNNAGCWPSTLFIQKEKIKACFLVGNDVCSFTCTVVSWKC